MKKSTRLYASSRQYTGLQMEFHKRHVTWACFSVFFSPENYKKRQGVCVCVCHFFLRCKRFEHLIAAPQGVSLFHGRMFFFTIVRKIPVKLGELRGYKCDKEKVYLDR